MNAGLDTRPTATTLDVEQLAKWAWEGRIRIPHFQRPLRWQRDDFIKLFDSIVRGYPVGSLLLWHRSARAETLQLGALRRDFHDVRAQPVDLFPVSAEARMGAARFQDLLLEIIRNRNLSPARERGFTFDQLPFATTLPIVA